MDIEEFRPIVGYEGLYEISSTGKVKSCERMIRLKNRYKKIEEHFIAQKDDTNGYLVVNLWKNNKLTHFKVHRLVAIAFIPNPLNLRDVNHIDENNYNNNASNLEWISHRDNLNYGSRNERANATRSKEVSQYDKTTQTLLATYKNAYIAESITGVSESNISACCLNKRKSAGGYIWKFTNFNNI